MAAKSRADYIKEHGGAPATFNLVDEPTVKKLKKDGKIKLPEKKLNVPKDKRWNERQMGSKVLNGIESGASVPTIAKSMTEVVGNNMSSAMRNARTMTTTAENGGRLDSYKNLDAQGVVNMKVWIATPDDRTRAEHLYLDGEEADIYETFSNGLMYPGDPEGEPEEVWNCRCTMESRIMGFIGEEGGYEFVDKSLQEPETRHNKQIAAEKQSRQTMAQQKAAEKSGGSITPFDRGEWHDTFVQQDMKWIESNGEARCLKLDSEERNALNIYTGHAYKEMNQYLRGIVGETRYDQEIELCKQALGKQKLAERQIVKRGCSTRTLETLIGQDQMEQVLAGKTDNLIGTIVKDEGFLSTTPSPHGGFGGSVTMWVELPKGSQALYIDSISRFRGEFETLVNAGSNYCLRDIKVGSSHIDVYMTLITKK